MKIDDNIIFQHNGSISHCRHGLITTYVPGLENLVLADASHAATNNEVSPEVVRPPWLPGQQRQLGMRQRS